MTTLERTSSHDLAKRQEQLSNEKSRYEQLEKQHLLLQETFDKVIPSRNTSANNVYDAVGKLQCVHVRG